MFSRLSFLLCVRESLGRRVGGAGLRDGIFASRGRACGWFAARDGWRCAGVPCGVGGLGGWGLWGLWGGSGLGGGRGRRSLSLRRLLRFRLRLRLRAVWALASSAVRCCLEEKLPGPVVFFCSRIARPLAFWCLGHTSPLPARSRSTFSKRISIVLSLRLSPIRVCQFASAGPGTRRRVLRTCQSLAYRGVAA